MRGNLIKTLQHLSDVQFSSLQFQDFDFSVLHRGDFLYADPPYLITCGSYNDGKRGFTGWSEKEENALYHILSDMDKRGIKFALSNVLEHKGTKNEILMRWCRNNGYCVHNVDFDYKNSNYHAKNTDKITREILVTNY